MGQALQQFLGKIGDFQEPLAKLALLHQRARAPAAPVNHLLVGQHGHVDRIPIDRRFLAIDQIVGIKVEEQRLLVAVIVRLAGGDLAAPVQRETEALQLRLHVGDVLARPAAGVHALFHGGVFGRHAKGVPAHWVQHLKALHRLIAGQHVTHRIVADMADVDAPRRIGKHLQHIGAGLGAGIIGAEALGLVPRALPAPVGHGRIETFTHTTTCLALNWLGLPEPRHLAAGGNPQTIGAQILVEDGDSHLHPLAGIAGIGVPIGDDDAARTVGLHQRHERQHIKAGAPQVGINTDGGNIAGRQRIAAANHPVMLNVKQPVGHVDAVVVAMRATAQSQHQGNRQAGARRESKVGAARSWCSSHRRSKSHSCGALARHRPNPAGTPPLCVKGIWGRPKQSMFSASITAATIAASGLALGHHGQAAIAGQSEGC